MRTGPELAVDAPGGVRPHDSHPLIDRASPTDLIQFAADVGPVPTQVGACLFLEGGTGLDAAAAQRLIGERVLSVTRLRQRLVRAPWGCGRPVWVDDPAFDLRNHVSRVRCPVPGDDQALLDLAAGVIGEPLPRSRPLWRAVLVTGLTGERLGLVLALHHVLADGVGGLAVLARLVDGAPATVQHPFPRPGPSRRELAVQAWATRLRAPTRVAAVGRLVRSAWTELGGRAPTSAEKCSLNRPTGPLRRVAVVRADLDAVLALAHSCGGTLNDAVLAAVAGAIDDLLATRGEHLDTLVVSVPVSGRTSTTGSRLGNQVGVMPVSVPTGGTMQERLARSAVIARGRKVAAPGASAVLIGPVFRLIAVLHLFRWFIERQRLVHTFVSNLRGPDHRLSFGGATVTAVIPIALAPGNVTMSFDVLSYAGTLVVTVVVDPELVPELQTLTAALRAELGPPDARPGHLLNDRCER